MFCCCKPVLKLSGFFVLVLSGSSAQAIAIGFSSAFFELSSLDLQGNVTINDTTLETSIDLFENNVPILLFNSGDNTLLETLSTSNTFGVTGNSGNEIIEASSSSTAINTGETTSALSSTSVLIPFFNTSDGNLNVDIVYGLFVSATSDAANAYSLSAAQVEFDILDENFHEIFLTEDALFQEAIQLEESQLRRVLSRFYPLINHFLWSKL